MMVRLTLLLALLNLLPAGAAAQLTPDQALKSFTVADGLQLELFAAEPMLTNPTCIDVDHKGRVWVCEAVNYRCHLFRKPLNRKEGDRIVILEDTKGTGKADKVTVFYQAPDFVAPLGIAVAPNPDGKGVKVYVCHSPHIYVFEDKDGDGKADGPPKILLTGFNGFDHDHGVHGIHFGPDGKLYFSVGDQGVKNLSSANGNVKADKETRRGGDKEKVWTTNKTDCQAGTVWRCNPDGTNLELLAHNFRNPYEPAVNSFGTMFMSDNDDDGNQQTRICYVMYGGNYGYWPRGKGESHWHEEQPGVVHKVLRTGFGSPTGMCWYEGTLLPKKYHGQLLHTDAGPRHVRCYHVKPKGAGYELEQEILVSSTDNWFRPVDVCVAPDGSVFIADWYDPGVGGHGMGDTTRGRIYRLTPKGHQGYQIPMIDLNDDQGVVASFFSPNLCARHGGLEKARTYGQKAQRLATSVASRVKQDDYGLQALLRWSWCFMNRELLERSFPEGLSPDPLPVETENMLFAFLRWTEEISPDLVQLKSANRIAASLAPHSSMGLRRELLVLLRQTDPHFLKDWYFQLAKRYDGQDHFYLAALGIAVGTDPKRREIILADFEKHFPEWNDKTAKLVWELRPPQVIAKLDQKLVDPKLTAAQKTFVLEILAGGDEQAGRTLLRIILGNQPPELRDAAVKLLKRHLPGKWRTLGATAEVRQVIDRYLERPAALALAFELIALAEAKDYASRLTSFVQNPKAVVDDPQAAQAALRAMASFKTPEMAAALGKLTESGPLQRDAIRALGQMQTHESLTPLKVVLLQQDRKYSVELRQEAIAALANSRQGSAWLLEEHQHQTLPADLLPDIARYLRNSPFQPVRNRALIAFPVGGKMNPEKLPAITSLASRRGDARRGRELVLQNKDMGCVRCHTIQGFGGQVGPDLSTIGVKGSRENLFESILHPDKAIADQYQQWVILDHKGVLMSGLIIEETPQHLLLRDGFGKDTKFRIEDIERRTKSKKSVMPSDLTAFMTEEDVVDIVEYLTTLKQPALAVDQWHIAGPFPNDMGRSFPPEAGVQLAAGYDGKQGKVKWRTVKPDATGYVDLRAFFAPQSDGILSYLYCEVESPTDQVGTILLGSDDEAKLRVNGQMVFAHQRHEAATPHRDRVEVQLKKGKNTMLLKINNGDGPHGFYFSILSKEPLKLLK
jgi:putative membrane-bound dehydrogenase-like protein